MHLYLRHYLHASGYCACYTRVSVTSFSPYAVFLEGILNIPFFDAGWPLWVVMVLCGFPLSLAIMFTINYRTAGNFREMQNFACFEGRQLTRKWDKLPHTGISHAKLLVGMVSWHWNANIRTHKHFCWGLWSQITKSCTCKYFPLYGIYSTCTCMH